MPDFNIPPNTWTNVHTASGITAGSGALLQNKSRPTLLLVESASQPAANSREGWLLPYGKELEVDAGTPGWWVFSLPGSTAFVQET